MFLFHILRKDPFLGAFQQKLSATYHFSVTYKMHNVLIPAYQKHSCTSFLFSKPTHLINYLQTNRFTIYLIGYINAESREKLLAYKLRVIVFRNANM